MRKTTQGFITACAGLVIGATFGAAPALAGPEWIPPGRVLGYYDSLGGCSSYASSLVLWDDDYDCDYWPQRVSQPYALVIERPVYINQPVPVVQQPVDAAPPMADPEPEPEPVGEPAAAEKPAKPVKTKSDKKKNKKHKDQVTITAEEPADAPEPVAPEPVAPAPFVPAPATIVPGPTTIVPVPVPVARPVVPVRPVLPIRPLVGGPVFPFGGGPCGPCF